MSESLSIQHDETSHQFVTTVDGHRAYLAYMDLGKQTLDIYRTFVPDSLRGAASPPPSPNTRCSSPSARATASSRRAPMWSATWSAASATLILRSDHQGAEMKSPANAGLFYA